MNWLRTVLSFAVVACISSMALRAESQVPVVRYRVAITPSSGADAEEIARILAATVRGRIEPYAEEGFVGFVVAATPSAAEILAHDPRVANVTILASDSIATPPPPSTRPSVVATEQRPTHIATNANELLLGPYAYDGSGNITEIGTSQDQFRYDAFGRLKTATVSGVAQDFSYDVYGNIESVTTNGSTATIGVDSATNRLKSTGTYNILGQYDAAGRMTGYLGRDTFIYDSLDMMKESVIQGQRKVYLYTASDERLASVVISGSAETTSSWTVRDIAGKVVRVYDKTMTGGERWWWKEDYIYREGKLLAAEVDTLAKTLHFHPDHLGTSRLITGNGGATIARHDYQPFGGEITAPNQDTEPMKFTGHERDYAGALTSDPLDYMHARYYSSSMGRFLTVDPVIPESSPHFPQRWNRYSYVMNNPMRYTDPTGKDIILSECVKDPDGNPCKDQLAAAQEAFGEAWSKVNYKDGIITLKPGTSPLALGEDFGPAAHALGFMAASRDHFTLIADAAKAAQGNGAYTEGLAGGGANIYYDPGKLGGMRTVTMGGATFGLAETLVHESGHAIEPYFANIQEINSKYSAVANTAHEAFPMFLQNAWRRKVDGKADNDIRVYILTPGDVNYEGTKLEKIWP